jgi:hypothetical protein
VHAAKKCLPETNEEAVKPKEAARYAIYSKQVLLRIIDPEDIVHRVRKRERKKGKKKRKEKRTFAIVSLYVDRAIGCIVCVRV